MSGVLNKLILMALRVEKPDQEAPDSNPGCLILVTVLTKG